MTRKQNIQDTVRHDMCVIVRDLYDDLDPQDVEGRQLYKDEIKLEIAKGNADLEHFFPEFSVKGGRADNKPNFQERVKPWLLECFSQSVIDDTSERNHRFLEESLELVQACGCEKADALSLVEYVYARPVGEKAQEAGGAMITLAGLCLAQDLDMHECGELELKRIWGMIEEIRNKHQNKPKGSALPQ